MIAAALLLTTFSPITGADIPFRQLASLTTKTTDGCRLRGDGIVTLSGPKNIDIIGPRVAQCPDYTVRLMTKKGSGFLIPIDKDGFYNATLATESTPRTFHVWDKNLNLVRDIPVSIGINGPNITDMDLYFLPETFTLVVNGVDREIKSVPGVEIQTYRGFDKDLNIYFACSNLKSKEVGYKEGKAFFAWYDQKDWHFPKTPSGYRHSFLRSVSDNGYGRVILSKQSTGASSALLIDGYEQVGAESVAVLSGVPRFFKLGKWYGETPPPIPTGKKRWTQEHQAVERWNNLALYETTLTSGDIEKKILRGKFNGKWVGLNGLTANRSVDYSKYELKGIRDGYILLEEQTDKSTKQLIILKARS